MPRKGPARLVSAMLKIVPRMLQINIVNGRERGLSKTTVMGQR